jgi:hypothetical protein
MDYSLVAPVIYGLLFGGALSVALGVHSKRTATNEIIHPIFKTNTTGLLNYFMVFLITFSVVMASTFSILIQDLTYPKENPLAFTTETFIMSLFPSLIIFILMFLRKKPITQGTYIEYALLAVKFGIAHILFQFSGIYTSVFGL